MQLQLYVGADAGENYVINVPVAEDQYGNVGRLY